MARGSAARALSFLPSFLLPFEVFFLLLGRKEPTRATHVSFTLWILSYSLFSFVSFYLHVYVLFFSLNLYLESFLILYFHSHPSTSYYEACCIARGGADGRPQRLSHEKEILLLFFLVVYRRYWKLKSSLFIVCFIFLFKALSRW
jgi:hypothetical protein